MTQHKGAITCLEFVTPTEDAGAISPKKKRKKNGKKAPTYLLSGSDDAAICIWRVRDWACIHIMGGHKGSVNALAAHASGRLALSVGRDKTLRMWDLTEGRMSFIVKLKREARWVPICTYLCVCLSFCLPCLSSFIFFHVFSIAPNITTLRP